MKWNNQSIIPMADFPVEKNPAEASPIIENKFVPSEVNNYIQDKFPEHIRKPLHDRSEEAKKAIIESMRVIVDKNHPDYKTKPITPSYAPRPVEDQPDPYQETSIDFTDV